MKRLVLIVLVGAAMLSGCSAGRNFTKPSLDEFKFGVTTRQQIVERYGRPSGQSSVVVQEIPIENLTYTYSSTAGKPHFGGVTPARGMTFGFHEDKLVMYSFISSFEEDHTYFPEDVLDLIEKGKTTRAELHEIIGKPSGCSVVRLPGGEEGEAEVYQYCQTRMSGLTPKIYQQRLVVTYDEKEVISDLVFSSEGTK